MKKLALLGASGHGKVMADLATELEWASVCFFDDAWPEILKVEHWDIVGGVQELLSQTNTFKDVFISIGSNADRKKNFDLLDNEGFRFPQLMHPSAIVSKHASVSEGVAIMAGVIVQAFTAVGRGCIINTRATIDHDCRVGDFAHVCPGVNLAGNVTVGNDSLIGIGSSVRQGISIGNNVIVGAGSVVVRNVPDSVVVYGNPARIVGYR